jgi:hypothetical protein
MAPTLNINSVGSYTVTVSWINDPSMSCYRSTLLVTDTVQNESDPYAGIRKYDVSLNNINPSAPTAFVLDGLINSRTYLITYIQSITQSSSSQSQSNTQSVVPYTIPLIPTIKTSVSYEGSGILVPYVTFNGDSGNSYNYIEFIYSTTTQMYNQIFDISNQVIPDGTDISFVLTGLTNFTTYEIACYIWNDAGPSKISNTWVATPTNLPGPPLLATATTLDISSAFIDWTAPLNESIANITYYAIDLSGNGRQFTDISSNFSYQNLNANDTSYTVVSLLTNKSYQFKVYAENLNGYGISSNITNLVIIT